MPLPSLTALLTMATISWLTGIEPVRIVRRLLHRVPLQVPRLQVTMKQLNLQTIPLILKVQLQLALLLQLQLQLVLCRRKEDHSLMDCSTCYKTESAEMSIEINC